MGVVATVARPGLARPVTRRSGSRGLLSGLRGLLSRSVARFSTETIAFDSADASAVVREMEILAARGDGLGWINIGPGLRDDQIDRLPEPTVLGRWFSGRGPAVPMATWTPPQGGSARSQPTVGVEHGAGPKALDRLRDAGAPLPAGWRKVQDHAKNGVVVHPPSGAPHTDVLAWLLSVCWALCPIEIEDHWLAEVHRPR